MLKHIRSKTDAYSAFRVGKWLWNILRRHRLQVGLNTGLGCLSVGLDFLFIVATKWAIDLATHKASGSLFLAAVSLTGILLCQIGINFASRWIKAILGIKAQNHMQQFYFDRLLHSRWQERNSRHSGDILNRLERDVTDVVNAVTETAPSLIAIFIRMTGAFLFLYSMDARLAGITVVIIPVFMLLSKLYMKRMRRLTREIRNTDSRIQSILQETIEHQMVIQTLGQQPAMIRRLAGTHNHLREQIRKRTKFSSVSSSLLNAGFMGCYLIAFLWGAGRLYEGTITYGMMIAFIQLVGQIQGPFRDMSRFMPSFVNAFTAGERLMQLEEIPLEREQNKPELSKVPGVRFENVTYAYTSGGKPILRQFTYDFPPGSRTAIVGETGAGKTTMIRLMLDLIRPVEGKITLYDPDRQTECNASTRSFFTYVPQGNTLFSGTIRDNLRLGNPDAGDDDLRRCLTDACAEFVLDLPQGLDTPCGERGVGLSEGQAQRIAIARALLRPGGILLLDEVTSSLDSRTEKRLWQNLTARNQGKTLIFVTHRTQIITSETRILHLDK
ncbi:MAG: ABC transporter ATP-binding protein/permease [Paraprevotella sp.]|nr:ABC transporter ATP-binding protein/permease [Paraprevotella sp.]